MEKCGAKCEVYSRVTGYFRPVANWNKGKQQEFKDRKPYNVAAAAHAMLLAVCCLLLTGCGNTVRSVTASASGKNLDLSGYVMLGELEMANESTATPQGRMIMGRVAYKSRKVGIPADQKVPNSGNFRATQTTGFFGTKELIIEYDWTAGSDADAKAAEEKMAKLKEAAERAAAAAEAKKGAATPAANEPAATAAENGKTANDNAGGAK